MSSSFLFSSSSSASSPLSYLIARPPPPPPSPVMPPTLMLYNNGAIGSGGMEAMPRQGRHPQPPLPRPPPRQCPRCGSANTKFCYYNNYSRTQPRYLCKACRRHWTEGGTLRDVPVGGGRKNKRSSKSSTTTTTKAAPTATTAPAAVATTSNDVFPEMLRHMLLQPSSCSTMTSSMSGYNIDLSAWQQVAAAPAPVMPPNGECNVGAGAATMEVNCGGGQYWSGWEDEISGLDGTC